MNESRQRFRDKVVGRLWREEGRIFLVQLLLLLVISTVLNIGFPNSREWVRIAEETQMSTIIRHWDGLAWYAWLVAAPVMLWLIRRYPLSRGRFAVNLGRIFVVSVLLYLVVAHLRYFLRLLPDLWRGSDPSPFLKLHSYAYNTFGMLPLDFLIGCSFYAVSLSVNYYYQQRRQAREAIQLQLRAMQLQSDLARAELAALRGQLHPHFLFNSFNALATLVRQHKNDTAIEIIVKLSALLRMAIERSSLQKIRLEKEIEFIRQYLEIEHLRFGDKLKVEFDLEPSSLNALVPNIVLQPVVENAIKHGISLRTTPGLVRIASTVRTDRLCILVTDDGPDGPPPSHVAATAGRKGIGLANARAQLDRLYGPAYRLELIKQPGGGTSVILELPLQWVPSSPTA
jgi:two-component system LytT family sensor kinase